MAKKDKNITAELEKYYRWFRRDCYRRYIRRVRITEQEIGGMLFAC